jgi:hypothetical protein
VDQVYIAKLSIVMELLEMDREPRYLITSSDERTWKFDRPVIFLGQWCLKHDRKHVWQNMVMDVPLIS